MLLHLDAGYLAVDGAASVYCEAVGVGPVIVLTHDSLVHREAWDAQFGDLAAQYTVIRWDRRGYGMSHQPTGPYSSVDDLARILRHSSNGPAVLVGSSFGALLTLHCALDHPSLVSALVLVGPIVDGLGFTSHFVTRGGHRPPKSDAPIPEQVSYWTETDPWFTAPSSVGARDRLRTLLTENPHNLRAKAGLQQPLQPSALSRLAQISVPTLVIVGEHDLPDVHAHSGAITAGIPNATRVVLPGCGHLPHMEVPSGFNRVVLDFLGSLNRTTS